MVQHQADEQGVHVAAVARHKDHRPLHGRLAPPAQHLVVDADPVKTPPHQPAGQPHPDPDGQRAGTSGDFAQVKRRLALRPIQGQVAPPGRFTQIRLQRRGGQNVVLGGQKTLGRRSGDTVLEPVDAFEQLPAQGQDPAFRVQVGDPRRG